MPHPSKILTLFLLGSVLVLSACASTSKPTGFLSSYQEFRAGPEGGVDKVWSSPEIKSPADWNQLIDKYKIRYS